MKLDRLLVIVALAFLTVAALASPDDAPHGIANQAGDPKTTKARPMAITTPAREPSGAGKKNGLRCVGLKAWAVSQAWCVGGSAAKAMASATNQMGIVLALASCEVKTAAAADAELPDVGAVDFFAIGHSLARR